MLFKFNAVFVGYKDNGKNAGEEDEKDALQENYLNDNGTFVRRVF